jgi:hypothetical protein
MLYAVLVETQFQYLSLGLDEDGPVFGRRKNAIYVEVPFEELSNVEPFIKKMLNKDSHIVTFKPIHDQPTNKQINFLRQHSRLTGYGIISLEKSEASKLIGQIIKDWDEDRDGLYQDPMEDYLSERYSGGGG